MTWWQVEYIGLLSPWKEQHSILIGINIYSGFSFAFPAHNASAKHCPWTYQLPYPLSLYSIQYCFWPKNSLHSQRKCTVGQQSWNPLVLPCFPPPRNSWPDREMEWSFEDTIIEPIRWQQCPICDIVSPIAGIPWKKEGGRTSNHLKIYWAAETLAGVHGSSWFGLHPSLSDWLTRTPGYTNQGVSWRGIWKWESAQSKPVKTSLYSCLSLITILLTKPHLRSCFPPMSNCKARYITDHLGTHIEIV